MTEEYFGGFAGWMGGITGTQTQPANFFHLDIIFITGMLIGVLAAFLSRAWSWLGITLAVAVLANTILHLIGTAATMLYSPGVISGAVFWLPLGGYTLFFGLRYLTRSRMALGMAAGIILSAIITGAVLTAGKGLGW